MPFYARKISFSFILKYFSCLFVCSFFFRDLIMFLFALLCQPSISVICTLFHPLLYSIVIPFHIYHFHKCILIPFLYLMCLLLSSIFFTVFSTIPTLSCTSLNLATYISLPPLIFPLSSIPIFSVCHFPLWP